MLKTAAMRNVYRKITIIKIRKPVVNDVNEELRWFGSSLGLFNLRDKDSSCYRIFVELLKAIRKQQGLTSDELAAKLNLSRGTIVHHLNKLVESGMVVSEKNKYFLREASLATLMAELRKDIERSYTDLNDVAKDIDGWMGF
jgi:predicted transcriptional regulator